MRIGWILHVLFGSDGSGAGMKPMKDSGNNNWKVGWINQWALNFENKKYWNIYKQHKRSVVSRNTRMLTRKHRILSSQQGFLPANMGCSLPATSPSIPNSSGSITKNGPRYRNGEQSQWWFNMAEPTLTAVYKAIPAQHTIERVSHINVGLC